MKFINVFRYLRVDKHSLFMWEEFFIRFHFGLNSWSSVRVCDRGMGQEWVRNGSVVDAENQS